MLALEASRLARNDRDWSQLVELGAITKVVLIDHDGIYDPRLVNDRLLLGLKGIMSDFEMATLRQRALEAQRTKAQRGELWMHLPVGLVYGPTGAIELDPDARVQQAIRLVLQKFDELGSTRQVLLWLRRERISVPVTRGGKHGRVHRMGAPELHARARHRHESLPRGRVRVRQERESHDDCRRSDPPDLGSRRWRSINGRS